MEDYRNSYEPKLTAADMAAEINQIANFLDAIAIEPAKGLETEYFGNPLLEASFYVESERQPGEDRTPKGKGKLFTRTLDAIHHTYRFDMPKWLSMELDTQKLQPETRKLLRQFDNGLKLYRKKVQRTLTIQDPDEDVTSEITNQRNSEKLSSKDTANFAAIIPLLISRLEASELGNTKTSIPVLVGNETVWISNKNKLGLFLPVLNWGSKAFFNENKVPEQVTTFMASISGAVNGIVENIGYIIATEKELQPHYQIAFEHCYDAIIAALRTGSRSLQMACLTLNKRQGANPYSIQEACEGLLIKIEVPPYPDSLESCLECAVVLEAIKKKAHLSEPQKEVLRQCSEQIAAKNTPAHIIKAVEDIISHFLKNPDLQLKTQAQLVCGFLQKRKEHTFTEEPPERACRRNNSKKTSPSTFLR
jgi:hypothetical protein